MCHCGARLKVLVLSFIQCSVLWDKLPILNPQRHIHKRYQLFYYEEIFIYKNLKCTRKHFSLFGRSDISSIPTGMVRKRRHLLIPLLDNSACCGACSKWESNPEYSQYGQSILQSSICFIYLRTDLI